MDRQVRLEQRRPAAGEDGEHVGEQFAAGGKPQHGAVDRAAPTIRSRRHLVGEEMVRQAGEGPQAIDVGVGPDAAPGLEQLQAEEIGEDGGRAAALVEEEPLAGQDSGGVAPDDAGRQVGHGIVAVELDGVAVADEGAEAQALEPAQRPVPEGDDGGRRPAHVRSVPPVAFSMAATTAAETLSISSSVSVRSCGCSVTAMATDFRPSPT